MAPAEDPFASAAAAPEPTPVAPAEDPFAAEAPAPEAAPAAPAEDPFAAEAPAPEATPAAPAEDPFAAEAPAPEATPTAPAEDPFVAEAPTPEATPTAPAEAASPEVAPAEPAETPAPPPVDPDFSAEEVLQQAILANVTGQSDEARGLFESIIAKAPDYAPVYFHFGQFLRAKNEEDKAREFFQTGLSKAQEQANEELIGQLQAELQQAEAPAVVEQPAAAEEAAAEEAAAEAPAAEAAPAPETAEAPAPEAAEAAPPSEQETSQPTLEEQLAALEAESSWESALALWSASEEKPAESGQRIHLALADSQAAGGDIASALQTVGNLLGLFPDLDSATAKKLELQRQQRDEAIAGSAEQALEFARLLVATGDDDKNAYVSLLKSKAESLIVSDADAALALIDAEVAKEGAPDELTAMAVTLLMERANSVKGEQPELAKQLAEKVLSRGSEHAEATALVAELTVEETPEWKSAEESGDLAKAAASVPEGDEHEEDRHRIYGALVSQQKEQDLATAINTCESWKQKVGEAKHADITGVLLDLHKAQVEKASGDELLAALDALKAAGQASDEWNSLVLTKAQSAKEQDASLARNLVAKLAELSDENKAAAGTLLCELGQTAIAAGDLEQAEADLTAATAYGESEAVTALGSSIVQKKAEKAIEAGQFEEAVTALEASGLSDEVKTPLLVSALAGQAGSAQDAGDSDKATELFNKVKELDPENEAAKAYFEAASAAAPSAGGGSVEAMELPEGADEALALLKEKLTDNAEDASALKAAYEKFGNKANARKLIDLFRELQKKNSGDPAYLLSLARAYSHVGKDTLAVVQFRKLLSNDPKPEVYLDLTRAYRRLKKMADASKTLETAMEKLPDDVGVKREQVIILSLSEEHSAAEAAAQEGVAMANASEADKEWFQKASELAGAGAALEEEMLEIPSRY